MKIQCPGCKSEYIVADHKIPKNGASMQCPKCEKRFMVRRSTNHETDPESLLRAQVRELSNSQALQKRALDGAISSPPSHVKTDNTRRRKGKDHEGVEVRFPVGAPREKVAAEFEFFQPVKDPSGLTRWLKYLLVANVFVLLAAIWSGWEEIQLLNDISSGRLISESQAGAIDFRQSVLGFTQFFLFVVTGIFFLSWVYRANCNARRLGAKGMRFSPGWSVGYFFIPVLNFWKPYQAMKEIWKASSNPKNWANQSVGLVLGLWWTLWIVSSVLGHAAFRTSIQAKMVNEIILSSQLTFASDLISVPLCLVAIYIISRIYGMQMDKMRPFLGSIA
jgi:predicted Zn finger-like uncharacterized protein